MNSPAPNHFRWFFLGILGLAFFVRLIGLGYWQNKADDEKVLFRFGDSHSYWTLAEKIADGKPYDYGGENSRIFRAPLYPIFLAPFTTYQKPRDGIVAARWSGLLAGVLCVAMVMGAAYRLAGERSSLIAGFLAATYPGAIGMSVVILSEAIFCPLMIASLMLASRACQRGVQGSQTAAGAQNPRKIFLLWFASGVLSGLACLARPSWFLWPASLLAFAILAKDRVKLLSGVLCLGLGMSLAMLPWWIRNYQETQRFVPTTLQVGASLYDGWHEGASGASDENMDFVDGFAIKQREEDAKQNLPLESTFEYRLDRRIHQAAMMWARQNPSDVILLGLIKFWKTWSPLPTASQVGGNAIRYGEGISYLIILSASVLGLWSCRRTGWSTQLYAFPAIYFGLLHTIFIGSVRYRQPAVLVLCVLAGIGIAQWNSRKKCHPLKSDSSS